MNRNSANQSGHKKAQSFRGSGQISIAPMGAQEVRSQPLNFLGLFVAKKSAACAGLVAPPVVR
jgi:hypothetical protein